MTTNSKRVPALDGLRGMAIAMVLICHIWVGECWAARPLSFWPNIFARATAHGVDLFFVLSGFLIGGILMDGAQSGRLFRIFYLRRAFRILPVYWLLVLTFVVVRVVDTRTRFGLISYLYDPNPLPVWRYLLFIQNVVMARTQSIEPAWLVATWSLAVEEQFYLLAPWVIRYLSRHLAALCVAGIVASVAARAYYIYAAGNNLCAANNLLLCRVDALCVGILVAIAVRSPEAGRWLDAHRAVLRRGLKAALMIYVAMPLIDGGTAGDPIFLPSVYAAANGLVLLYLVRIPAGRMARALSWPPLVGLGGVSYFVYLFHLPFWFVATITLERVGNGLGGIAWVLSTALVLLAAVVSRRWFEQPILRLSNRLSYGSRRLRPAEVHV